MNQLSITHVQDQVNQAVHLRHLIIAEAESQATIIEEYRGRGRLLLFD